MFDENPNIRSSRCKLLKKTIKLQIIRNKFSDEKKKIKFMTLLILLHYVLLVLHITLCDFVIIYQIVI